MANLNIVLKYLAAIVKAGRQVAIGLEDPRQPPQWPLEAAHLQLGAKGQNRMPLLVPKFQDGRPLLLMLLGTATESNFQETTVGNVSV